MNLGQLREALELIGREPGVSDRTPVLVRMHPDLMINMTDSLAAIRSVESVDDDGDREVAVYISNAVVR